MDTDPGSTKTCGSVSGFGSATPFLDGCVQYLDGGTLELPEERAVVAKHGHVEPVPVAVANQNVASI
jgi:hypothetical protein